MMARGPGCSEAPGNDGCVCPDDCWHAVLFVARAVLGSAVRRQVRCVGVGRGPVRVLHSANAVRGKQPVRADLKDHRGEWNATVFRAVITALFACSRLQRIPQGKYEPVRPIHVSAVLCKLVSWLLTKEPLQRPSSSDILSEVLKKAVVWLIPPSPTELQFDHRAQSKRNCTSTGFSCRTACSTGTCCTSCNQKIGYARNRTPKSCSVAGMQSLHIQSGMRLLPHRHPRGGNSHRSPSDELAASRQYAAQEYGPASSASRV
jgi:hypothetical protein